jgi:hypothetical protein
MGNRRVRPSRLILGGGAWCEHLTTRHKTSAQTVVSVTRRVSPSSSLINDCSVSGHSGVLELFEEAQTRR